MIYSVKTHLLVDFCQKEAKNAKIQAKNGKEYRFFMPFRKNSLFILFIFNVIILLVNFF